MNSTFQKSIPYLHSIDSLRALAVITVLLNHFYPDTFRSGFLGVDVFFVISGFVVTYSLLPRLNNFNPSDILSFYSRRLKRLYAPLIITILLFSFIATLFIYPKSSELSGSLSTGFFGVLGVSNLYLFFTQGDYFSVSANYNLFIHTWSLGVEEQFYLFFPIVLFLSRTKFRILFVLLVLFSASIFLHHFYLSHPLGFNSSFYLPSSRSWEFLLGAIVCLCTFSFPSVKVCFSTKIAVYSLLFLATSLLISQLFTFTPEYTLKAYLKVCFPVALILFILSSFRLSFPLFSFKPLQYIGSISYSLYLIHWPLLVLSRWFIDTSDFVNSILLVATFFFSILSFHLVEQPIRKSSIAHPFSIFKYFFIIPVSFSLLSITLISNFARYIFIGKYFDTPPVLPDSYPHPPVSPSLASSSTLNRENCFKKFSFVSNSHITHNDISRCTISSSGPTIFLYGDSFAAHLTPIFDKLLQNQDFGLVVLTAARCPFPPRDPSISSSCSSFYKARLAHLLDVSRPGDILVLSSSAREPSGFYSSFYISELNRILPLLGSRGVSLVYQAPFPRFSNLYDPVCTYPHQNFTLNRYRDCSSPSLIDRDLVLSRLTALFRQLHFLSLNHSNFYFIDSFQVLCPSTQTVCSTHRNSVRLYRDGIHLSTSGSLMLFDSFVSSPPFSK